MTNKKRNTINEILEDFGDIYQKENAVVVLDKDLNKHNISFNSVEKKAKQTLIDSIGDDKGLFHIDFTYSVFKNSEDESALINKKIKLIESMPGVEIKTELNTELSKMVKWIKKNPNKKPIIVIKKMEDMTMLDSFYLADILGFGILPDKTLLNNENVLYLIHSTIDKSHSE